MAQRDLPLTFGLALAGFVLLDKGAKAAGAAFQASTGSVPTGAQVPGGSGTLPSAAAGHLNADQQAFASELARRTGLDPTVIAAWVASEEPASSTHAPNGANNWLNIGSVDSGNWQGGADPVWGTPQSGADATAAWLRGSSVYGIGTASSGIRAIMRTVGQSAAAQVHAIQSSGWASSGYPHLGQLVAELDGQGQH